MARALRPFHKRPGDLNGLRERLLDTMWEDAGVIRDRAGLERAVSSLDSLGAELQATGLYDGDRSFNMTWHDWLNLESLIAVSKVIAKAALKRENSRGAHYREDFPEPGELATSTFTVARLRDGSVEIGAEAVDFTIVRPGESLLDGKRAAE